jgi:hypothetical protein
VYNAWIVRWMIGPDASRMDMRTEPLPLTSTPTPPTRERVEGGVNVKKSLRNAVKMIDRAESTTQNCERSRPKVMDDEKATELKETLNSV